MRLVSDGDGMRTRGAERKSKRGKRENERARRREVVCIIFCCAIIVDTRMYVGM